MRPAGTRKLASRRHGDGIDFSEGMMEKLGEAGAERCASSRDLHNGCPSRTAPSTAW
jgi:hypothetical protein